MSVAAAWYEDASKSSYVRCRYCAEVNRLMLRKGEFVCREHEHLAGLGRAAMVVTEALRKNP